jgi:uncharacterized membrane protein
MTIHKEGTTTIALCILFIFVLNALIQFYHPHATTVKWIIYILSFILFVFVILLFTSLKEGKPIIPVKIRNIFLSGGSVSKEQEND